MRDRWAAPALGIVLAITLLRIVLLAFDRAELFVDETQYWLWGQVPALGYYSKPPLLGWVLGLASATCGDTPFCIRLPGPLFHAATALILAALAARLVSPRAAIVVAAGYVTLPLAAIGSLQIATDTIMAPFLALALAGWFACLGGAGTGIALATGVALGLAFLAKYAAIYYLPCAGLAWLVLRPRPSGRQMLAILGGFLAAAAPNILWNIAEGFPTLSHTLDNVGWVRDPADRAGLHPGGMAAFLALQGAFFGPVAVAALVWLGATWRRRGPAVRQLLLFSLPIVGLVAVQALVSQALLNWAGAAYVAATLAVMPALSRPWLAASLALNGAFCVFLPVLTLFADRGAPLMERYRGRVGMSEAILAAARAEGLTTAVATDREVLADLFYTGRDSGLVIRARPHRGRPRNHYEFRYSYAGGSGDVLLVLAAADPAPCQAATRVQTVAPPDGRLSEKAADLLAGAVCLPQPGLIPRSRSPRRRSSSTVVSSAIETITRIVATDRIAGEICSRIPFHICRGIVCWS